jgi:hypothetical protein
MRRKKNTTTVNIRHWEQASFLPKIKYPVAAQTLTQLHANEAMQKRQTLTGRLSQAASEKPEKVKVRRFVK